MSWIEDFCTRMSMHMDTPDELIEGVAYFLAGAALANRVYVKSPDEVGTNVYVILISPPGWFRKSTPIRIGLRAVRPILGAKEVLPSNPSVEAMAKVVSEICVNGIGHGVMVYDEFRSFVTHVRKEYAASIASLVTEKLDTGIPVSFARKKEGGVEVDTIPGGFVLSFIASTTTPWLLENLRSSDISGGMLSRFLLVGTRERTRTYELPPPIDDQALLALAADLQRVQQAHTRTEFTFEKRAARDYSAIYRDIEKKARSQGHPEYPSLVSRAPLYLKKLALTHAALEERGDGAIRAEDVEAAGLVVFRSIEASTEIVDEAVAIDGMYGRNLMRVRKILAVHERIKKGQLLRLVHLRIRELDDILDSLREQGHVAYEKDGNGVWIVWKD